jgi:hypothetical protein
MQHTILYSETIIDIFEHTLKYSNQAEQIYLTYSWFGVTKRYIYFAILYYMKIIVSQWVKYHLGCVGLLTRTQHWRTLWSLQSGHYPANIGIVRLHYELYTLWRLNYLYAHTSLYPFLKLVRYLNYFRLTFKFRFIFYSMYSLFH